MSHSETFINEYSIQEKLTPRQMDYAWAHGWRHFGNYFFRYSIAGDKHIQHVVPLRIKLADVQLSTSQKRVWRRNRDLNIKIRDAFIDDDKRALFDRHKTRFREHVPDQLSSFLGDEPAHIPCRTKEICLFKDVRLVAASFLDIGETSTSSIYAMFEPAESKRSLGIYLILLSIKFSGRVLKKYYYTGYAYEESIRHNRLLEGILSASKKC